MTDNSLGSTPPTTPKPATQRSSKPNYDQLPEAFRPPRNRKTGLRNGGEPLLQLLPVRTLPRGLLPKVGYHYQPPRFYYGWPCGMARLQELREIHPDIISLFRGSDVIDVPIVIGNIKRYTAKNLEITSFIPHFSPIADPALYGLALADSYFVGCKRPPQEDVKEFQQWLGIKEDPLWYLDGTKNCPRDSDTSIAYCTTEGYRKYLNPYRPAIMIRADCKWQRAGCVRLSKVVSQARAQKCGT